MINLSCPSCNRPMEHVFIRTQQARCDSCDLVYDIYKTQLNDFTEGYKIIKKPDVGIDEKLKGQDLYLRVYWRSFSNWRFFISCGFVILVIVVAVLFFIQSAVFSVLLYLLGLMAIYLFYDGMMRLTNSTELLISPDRMTCRHQFPYVGIPRSIIIKKPEIERIYISRKVIGGNGKSTFADHHLSIQIKDQKKPVYLLTALCDLIAVRYIEMRIKQHMGLRNKRRAEDRLVDYCLERIELK